MNTKEHSSRRAFLGKMIGAATAASLPVAGMSSASAVPAEMDLQDRWMGDVMGKHKCLFDFPAHKKGAGLIHIYNYIATYQAAYGADVSDVGTVGTFYAIGPNASLSLIHI